MHKHFDNKPHNDPMIVAILNIYLFEYIILCGRQFLFLFLRCSSFAKHSRTTNLKNIDKETYVGSKCLVSVANQEKLNSIHVVLLSCHVERRKSIL